MLAISCEDQRSESWPKVTPAQWLHQLTPCGSFQLSVVQGGGYKILWAYWDRMMELNLGRSVNFIRQFRKLGRRKTQREESSVICREWHKSSNKFWAAYTCEEPECDLMETIHPHLRPTHSYRAGNKVCFHQADRKTQDSLSIK